MTAVLNVVCTSSFDDQEAEAPETTDVLKAEETVEFTNVVCDLLNTKTCSCTKYDKRTELVPDCVQLTRDNLKDIFYMPPSCSYRRLQEGRGLPSWHPLLNRNKKTVMHKAGMSVRGKTVYEHQVDPEHYEDYIVVWPFVRPGLILSSNKETFAFSGFQKIHLFGR